jgi:hypothetical protein
LGVAWILARLTDTVNGGKYEEVVQRELEFLMYGLKRTTDGAMSHRPNEEDVQLWCVPSSPLPTLTDELLR